MPPPDGTSAEDRADSRPASLRPGTRVADRYTIVGELGQGGMGTVYLAEHQHMRKRVALKVLHPDMANVEEVARRFEREAIASAHITHPNVAAALDFIRTGDGTCLLVLEYAEGDTLRDMVSKGPLPSGVAIQIAHEIALALEAAHDKGVVHRDLKPENVVVHVDGAGQPISVKVLDFGVAKIDFQGLGGSQASDQPLTRMGAVLGTPDYMAPEQAMGDRVDHRADFYAVGMMLAEMLTGKRPFRGGAMTVLRQRVLGNPLEATDLLGEGTDPELLELLRKLLATAPGDRPGSASDIVKALDALRNRDVPVALPADLGGGKDSTSGTAATALASPTARDDFYDRTTVAIAPGRESASPAGPAPLQHQQRRSTPWGFIAFVAVMAIGIGGAVALFLMSRWKTDTNDHRPRKEASPDSKSEDGKSTPPGNRKAGALKAGDVDELDEEEDTVADAGASPPVDHQVEKPTKPKRSSSRKKKSSSAASKPKRRTGPGGIYIPPPKNWF